MLERALVKNEITKLVVVQLISPNNPQNMTGEPYLTVPFYNSTFYLFKANASCPEAFSFTVKGKQ